MKRKVAFLFASSFAITPTAGCSAGTPPPLPDGPPPEYEPPRPFPGGASADVAAPTEQPAEDGEEAPTPPSTPPGGGGPPGAAPPDPSAADGGAVDAGAPLAPSGTP